MSSTKLSPAASVQRPSLVVVQPLLLSQGSSALAPEVVPPGPVEGGPASSRPALRLVAGTAFLRPKASLSGPARLRVTRAGRLTITLSVAFLLGLGLLTAASSLASGGSEASDRTVVVLEGQTLSGIAAAELPGLPVLQGVTRIQLANDLSTTAIHAGQRLAIPRLR